MVWAAVASSADGNKLVAIGSYIYTSTNAGTTWTQANVPMAEYLDWTSVASSADGNKLAAYSYSLICTSTNSGATWENLTNFITNSRGPQTIACSADGTTMAAAAITRVHVSTNCGASWQWSDSAPFVGGDYSVATSWDGKTIVVAAGGYYIYTLSNPPPVYVNIGISIIPNSSRHDSLTNFLALSWPSWATNVSVQQSSNLNCWSWTTITNVPSLTTNIAEQTTKYQIFLPRTNSQMFFWINSP